MKNIALCFDHVCDDTGSSVGTNSSTLAALLQSDDQQVVWSRCDSQVCGRHHFAARLRQSRGLALARASMTEAYQVLVDRWEPGDRLYLFGAGRGGHCARALARLLGTVGVLRGPDVAGWTAAEFREYVLSTYALPGTLRSPSDWQRVGQLAAQLCGRSDIAVDVDFLGLWDSVPVPGLPRPDMPDPLPNVIAARHAVAIDGGHGLSGVQSLLPAADGVEEVWFRGAHRDVTGGQHAHTPLSDIALDWVLDGAVTAGAVLRISDRPAPAAADALAGSTRTLSFRKVPSDAAVHASVASYLRSHPSYWRRLPGHVVWADSEWAARSERLLPAPAAPPVLATAS